jgi:DNA-binding NarL/FixJ family response regulator
MLKSILIVGDNRSIRRLIRATFQQYSRDFEICGEPVNGVDDIEKAKDLKPDVILLDLAMPEMNGLEAASALKRMMPSVLIILFTIYNDIVCQSFASAIGVDTVLCKTERISNVECVKSLLQPAQSEGGVKTCRMASDSGSR